MILLLVVVAFGMIGQFLMSADKGIEEEDDAE